jgi:hypothetical protein
MSNTAEQNAENRYYEKARRAAAVAEDNPWMAWIAWVLLIGLTTGLVTLGIITVKPYYLVMSSLGGSIEWTFQIPLIGGAIEGFATSCAYIAALLLWIPVHILKCLWIVIGLDAKAQKSAIRQSAAIRDAATFDRLDGQGRRATKRMSRSPFFFVKWAGLMAIGAYVFDAIVGLKAYPVWDSMGKFTMWAKSFNPIWIHSDHAINLLISLFAFEVLLILVIVVAQWVWHRKQD